MKYVTGKMLVDMQRVKGKVIKSTDTIAMVETVIPDGTVYTVWNPEEGFHFTNTFDRDEAEEAFKKYSKEIPA
jgi:hypothetical protein